MKDSGENNEKRVKDIFTGAMKNVIEPNPFLKTRVMANLENEKARLSNLFWKRLAFAGPLLISLVFMFFILTAGPSFKVSVGENVLVKIEISEIPRGSVAFTQIELPEGVTFYSKRFPELNEQSDLELAWNGHFPQRYLPMVIRSSSKGTKDLVIKFLDQNRNVISEKSLRIKFLGSV